MKNWPCRDLISLIHYVCCDNKIHSINNLVFQDNPERTWTRSSISSNVVPASFYLDVIVDASWQDLIAGVVERHSQHLVGVLESVDGSFFTDVPELQSRQWHQTESTIKPSCVILWPKNVVFRPKDVDKTICIYIYIYYNWKLENSPSLSRRHCRCRWVGVHGELGSTY